MTDDTDRGVLRVTLKAFAIDHACEVHYKDRKLDASLIDINTTRARLRMQNENEKPPKTGDLFSLNIKLDVPGVETGNLHSVVRWVKGREFGVKFVNVLGLSVGELQELLDSP